MINNLKSVQSDMIYSFFREGPAEQTHFTGNLVRVFPPPEVVTGRSSSVFPLFTAHFTHFSGSSETAAKAGSSYKIHRDHYLNYFSF